MIRHQSIRAVLKKNYFPVRYSARLEKDTFELDDYIFEFYQKANNLTKSSVLTSKFLIIIDGYIFYNDRLIDVSFILENIENINKIAQAFNGSYNLVVYDISLREMSIWNDLYASRPLYIQNKIHDVSLLPLPQLSQEVYSIENIDETFVINQLIYSRIKPQNNTIINGVAKISGGCFCQVKNGKFSQSSFLKNLSFSKDNANYQESLGNLVASLRKAVKKVHSLSSDLTLHLSGGLDSRLMACLFHQEGLNIKSVTWGSNQNSLEVNLASRVSESLDIEHKFLQLSKEMFLPQNGGDSFFESTSLGDLFSHEAWSNSLTMHDPSNTGHYTSGISFDVMHGIYSDGFNDYTTYREILRSFKYNSFDSIVFQKPARSKSIYEELKKEYHRELNEFNAPAQDTATLFALKARAERVLFPRQIFIRSIKDELTPAFDSSVLDAMASFSASSRSERKILRDVIMTLNSDASHIPYLSTLLPVSAPIELWRQAKKVEAARQKIYRDLDYFDGSYTDIIKYPYYSNYDSWIATDISWRGYLEDLLHRDSILASHFVSSEWLEEQLTLHGKRHNKFQYIMVLASLELGLRSVLNKR